MTTKIVIGSLVGLGLLAGGAVLAARLGTTTEPDYDTNQLALADGTGIDHDANDVVAKPRIILDERDADEPSTHAGPLGLSNRSGFQMHGGDFKSIEKSKEDWMARFDTDSDGHLSEEEIIASKEVLRAEREARKLQWLLEKYDTDNDGVLSAEENEQIEADRLERIAKREKREAERKQLALDAYDTDGDGVLSDAEKEIGRQAHRDYMTKQHEAMQAMFDADSNGEVTNDERKAMHETMSSFFRDMKLVRTFDADGDHAITTADMPAYMDMFLAGDARADLDYNGVVNEADLASFQQVALTPPNPAMVEAMGWFQNAPPSVDGGFGNIMMLGGGKDMIVHTVEGGNMTIKGVKGTFRVNAELGDMPLDGGEHAIVIIETIESVKDD